MAIFAPQKHGSISNNKLEKMSGYRYRSLLFFCLVFPLLGFAEIREWRDKNGNILSAVYVNKIGGKVVLKDERGKIYKLDPSKLSEEDQYYLNNTIPPTFELTFKRSQHKERSPHEYEYYIVGSLVIEKKNKEPYTGELKAVFLMIGLDEKRDTYVILDRAEERFTCYKRSTFSLIGNRLGAIEIKSRFHVIIYRNTTRTAPVYIGYYATVMDSEGNIITCQSDLEAFEEAGDFLLSCQKNDLFSRTFEKVEYEEEPAPEKGEEHKRR